MTAVKIGIVGAGSAAWSAVLIKDLCLTRGLSGSTISFMDINKERLDMVYGLARRYMAEVKADLKFEKTMDRREALRSADFVFNAALAGGHEKYEIQRGVAEKHGYYRGIDSVDHNMVSDYYTIGAYNQLKLFLGVASDMEEICPDAWLIQTANPVFEGCTLLTRGSKLKVVGLCHGHLGYKQVAKVLGLDPKDITFQAVGFNHCIWMTDFRHKGENAYPLIDEWINTKAKAFWRVWKPKYHETDMSPAAVDMYRRFGVFPVGDTTRSGGWKYHTNLETKKRWYGPLGGFDSEIGWPMYLDDLRNIIDRMFRANSDPSVILTKELPPVMSEESHVPIIDAIVNDKEGVFQVNISNDGAISGIPDDVVVEIPAVVSGRGIQGVHVGELPKRLMLHVVIPRMLRMEWALEAFLTGDRNVLTDMLLNDPRTRNSGQAEAVIEDILALPFNKVMAEHYR